MRQAVPPYMEGSGERGAIGRRHPHAALATAQRRVGVPRPRRAIWEGCVLAEGHEERLWNLLRYVRGEEYKDLREAKKKAANSSAALKEGSVGSD